MKESALQKIKELHNKVIHSSICTDEEYFLEDKKMRKLNNATINLICPKCFPLGSNVTPENTHPRASSTYDIRYPQIHKIH